MSWPIFAQGDVLDVGTNHGLSASILSEAINQKETSVFTIDLDQRMATKAEENFQRLGLDNIILIVNDATSAVQQLFEKNKRFGFAFVDHSHEFYPVRSLCKILFKVMKPNSYVAFHDFIDNRNSNVNSDFDVPAAVIDGLGDKFKFVCCSGCTGVYQRSSDEA